MRCSNQFPILLKLDHLSTNPGAFFKYNPSWVEKEEFQPLIKDNWIIYNPELGTTTCKQFFVYLRIVKEKVVVWVG